MNLVADEDVDGPIVERLRQHGHNVLYIAEMVPGISDDDVLRQAGGLDALLLTADKDFGELVFRQRRLNSGVVLLRLGGLTSQRKVEIVAVAFRDHAANMAGGFSVISPGSLRIRRNI